MKLTRSLHPSDEVINCYIKYMNISFSWLKKYVDFDLTPEETAEILTSIGLEVAAVGRESRLGVV